ASRSRRREIGRATDSALPDCLRGRGLLFAEAEVGAVDPHAVQDDGELPGQGHGSAPQAAAFGNRHRPAFETGEALHAREHGMGRFIECAAHHGVPGFGDAAGDVDGAGLVLPRSESDSRAPNRFDVVKRVGSSTPVLKVSAVKAPTPGTVIRWRQTWSVRAIASNWRCSTAISLRSTSRALSIVSPRGSRMGWPAVSSRTRVAKRETVVTPIFKP